MKKLIAMLLALFAFISVIDAQRRNDDLYAFSQRENIVRIDSYEKLLKKSRNFQYAAVGSTAASIGLFVAYASQKEKFSPNEDGELKMKDKAKYFLAGGGVFGAVALLIELQAINYRFKAGQSLNLKVNGEGAGLSFNF